MELDWYPRCYSGCRAEWRSQCEMRRTNAHGGLWQMKRFGIVRQGPCGTQVREIFMNTWLGITVEVAK
jgi:hypothetical protein